MNYITRLLNCGFKMKLKIIVEVPQRTNGSVGNVAVQALVRASSEAKL